MKECPLRGRPQLNPDKDAKAGICLYIIVNKA